MENKVVKGYKVFNNDWACQGFQYKVGHVYEMAGFPRCYNRGFHFYLRASDCFRYYNFDPDNKAAEIEALGEIVTKNVKSYTNKIKIVREIPWNELFDIVNEGKRCTGFGNTGDINTGNWNGGNWNAGNYNTGDWNVGDNNSGDGNIGNWNSGDKNTGKYNTGDWNTGNWNAGDWNKSSFNNGCFNTVAPTIMMFNKPSDWTYEDWLNSGARRLLNGMIPNNLTKWVLSEDMTDAEKDEHPEHKTTGGYLRILDESECRQIWWDSLNDAKKEAIKSLPNFDPIIFKECTGISV